MLITDFAWDLNRNGRIPDIDDSPQFIREINLELGYERIDVPAIFPYGVSKPLELIIFYDTTEGENSERYKNLLEIEKLKIQYGLIPNGYQYVWHEGKEMLALSGYVLEDSEFNTIRLCDITTEDIFQTYNPLMIKEIRKILTFQWVNGYIVDESNIIIRGYCPRYINPSSFEPYKRCKESKPFDEDLYFPSLVGDLKRWGGDIYENPIPENVLKRWFDSDVSKFHSFVKSNEEPEQDSEPLVLSQRNETFLGTFGSCTVPVKVIDNVDLVEVPDYVWGKVLKSSVHNFLAPEVRQTFYPVEAQYSKIMLFEKIKSIFNVRQIGYEEVIVNGIRALTIPGTEGSECRYLGYDLKSTGNSFRQESTINYMGPYGPRPVVTDIRKAIALQWLLFDDVDVERIMIIRDKVPDEAFRPKRNVRAILLINPKFKNQTFGTEGLRVPIPDKVPEDSVPSASSYPGNSPKGMSVIINNWFDKSCYSFYKFIRDEMWPNFTGSNTIEEIRKELTGLRVQGSDGLRPVSSDGIPEYAIDNICERLEFVFRITTKYRM